MNVPGTSHRPAGRHVKRGVTLALGTLALALSLEGAWAMDCARVEPLPQCASARVEQSSGSSYWSTVVRIYMTNNCNHNVTYHAEHSGTDWPPVQFTVVPGMVDSYRFYYVSGNMYNVRTRVEHCVPKPK